MKNLLMITPHLSTGGLPQFLLDKIQILKNHYNCFLIEWENITGGVFVVQRNKITELLKSNFYTLSEDKSQILKIISNINPDIIHFEEFSETFVNSQILKDIYSNTNYYITETTHGTSFNAEDKFFIPDKMMFVSKGNYNQYRHITKDTDVIEFPNKWKKRNENLERLGLDPSYKHVLNVGLFTPGKNQAEIFEIAKQMTEYKIQFHFVGNQAGNFQDYWQPLMNNKPNNCFIWGERDDVDNFYKSMDLFLYTSIWENRPLSVLEAINHDMTILMHNLNNYADDFAKNDNVNFLTKDEETNIKLLTKLLNIKKTEKEKIKNTKIARPVNIEQLNRPKVGFNINAYHILTDIDTEREIRSVSDLAKLEDWGISYNPIISKRYTELPPKETCAFPEIVSMEPGGKLTPAHYGCYLGHRKAFETGYKDNPDYMLIFECDAILDVTHNEFIDKLKRACEIIEKEDLLMFSLGFHNGQNILEKKEDYFIIDTFIGAHAYLIPRKSYQIIYDKYQTQKWNVADLWLGNNLRSWKQGIYPHPITKQAGGISILEQLPNEDRY